jgi:hypothetical protein
VTVNSIASTIQRTLVAGGVAVARAGAGDAAGGV